MIDIPTESKGDRVMEEARSPALSKAPAELIDTESRGMPRSMRADRSDYRDDHRSKQNVIYRYEVMSSADFGYSQASGLSPVA